MSDTAPLMADSSDAVVYQVRHETHYDYTAPVVHAHHLLHLAPRETAWQKTLLHRLELQPLASSQREDDDAFGNCLTRIELARPHRQLQAIAHTQVALTPRRQPPAADSMPWERLRDELSYCGRPRSARELEAVIYRVESPHARIKNAFSEFADECFPHGQPILACAEALMHKLHRELTYDPKATHVGTPVSTVLESRRGVCQDFAHLMIACLRSRGLAARYVSGYLRTVAPEGGTVLTGADASHAWVSVYAPPFDWVDLDPTNDVHVNTDHITLSWGRDFSDVSPVRGVIVGGGEHEVSVAVTVRALDALDASAAMFNASNTP
ncbi:MAG: transglutaminase domain-containing protein [Steroidobacteraceae bacterium]